VVSCMFFLHFHVCNIILAISSNCSFRDVVCQFGIYVHSELTYVSLEFMSIRNWHMSVWNLCPFRTDINFNWYKYNMMHISGRTSLFKCKTTYSCALVFYWCVQGSNPVDYNIVYTLEVTILDFSEVYLYIIRPHTICGLVYCNDAFKHIVLEF